MLPRGIHGPAVHVVSWTRHAPPAIPPPFGPRRSQAASPPTLRGRRGRVRPSTSCFESLHVHLPRLANASEKTCHHLVHVGHGHHEGEGFGFHSDRTRPRFPIDRRRIPFRKGKQRGGGMGLPGGIGPTVSHQKRFGRVSRRLFFDAMQRTAHSRRNPFARRTRRNVPGCVPPKATTPLQEGIARFYDASSALWEDMWGEHMHHGYYPEGKVDQIDHREAQVDMVERVLNWADVQSVQRMVDVGCGIGGSSRHVVRKYPGSSATGISLSSKQVERANQITREAGLDANFQVADALQQPFEDGSYDLVWSLESGEHMPDKKRFVQELARVCAPGGTIIVVTWCHRVLQEGEALRAEEEALLKRICDAYYLPAWCSIRDYEDLMKEQGLESIQVDDWSEFVAPFWGAVIRTALQPRGMVGLLNSGWETLRGALVMPLMAQGFRMGLIKFNLIAARKPQ